MAADVLARGLAAKTWAAARAQIIAVEELGATGTGNDQPAVQRAIDLAVANRVPRVTCRLPRLELWEKPLSDPNGFGVAFNRVNRTLAIPACDSLDLDFGGAQIVIKGPTGGARGQAWPGGAVAGISTWYGGFMMAAGVIKRLRIANVDVDGGFDGNWNSQAEVNLTDNAFGVQDLGDVTQGAGLGFGTLIHENVCLHGFRAELMYDNSSREHINIDCHYYNSPQSAWNPTGSGRLVAYNLRAGRSYQAAEVIGGVGHFYHGGLFYDAGSAGSTFIGSNNPNNGVAFNQPVRDIDKPPPYIQFNGTRFENFLNYLYLGSYSRGSVHLVDTHLYLAAAFASAGTLKDIDLEVFATADRTPLGVNPAVTLAGPASNDGSQPRNIRLGIHAGRTRLAQDNGASFASALAVYGLVDAPSVSARVEGFGCSAYEFGSAAAGAGISGWVAPLVEAAGFRGKVPDGPVAFSSDKVHTVLTRSVTLFPQAAGTFAFTLNPAPGYTHGQRVRFVHDGSGSGDRIVFFPKDGAGMRLRGNRFLSRDGHYLELERSQYDNLWVEAGFAGDDGRDSTQAGTSYTAALADGDGMIRFTSADPVSFTIPPNGSVAFPVGTVLSVEQAGAGPVTFVAGAGVTLNARGADLTLAGQYSVAFARKVAADSWTVGGDL